MIVTINGEIQKEDTDYIKDGNIINFHKKDIFMSNETEVKKTRTPRTVESITAGALALNLAERVELTIQLQASINDEVARLETSAKQAQETAAVLRKKIS